MCCVLCLDPTAIQTILINSTEVQELDIRSIIEKYFTCLKVDAIYNANSCICRQCWQALLTFHQFYKQVERAHKILECDLAPAENCGFAQQLPLVEAASTEKEDVEEESRQFKLHPKTTIKEVVKDNRRHGLTRIKRLVDGCPMESRKRAASANMQKHKIEELFLDASYVDVQSGNLSETEKKVPEQIFDESNLEFISEAAGSEALEKSSKIQHVYSKKARTSRESDEYIAEHFNLCCSICSVALKNFNSLETHFWAQHHTRGYALCCGKKLLKRGLLVDHLHMHQDPAYFRCPHCGKQLASRRCLELHLERHDKPKEHKYECKICDRKFSLRTSYVRHLLVHLPEEKKTVPCQECEKKFATKYLMNQHLRLVHLNTYAKICDICGKSLVSSEALRLHLEEHSGMPRPVIHCDLCGVTLTSKYGLNRHMKVIHSEENRQQQVCPICSKVSSSVDAHKRHITNVHNKVRLHVCSICTRGFKRPFHLKQHMTTHTGEILYTCPHCPKTFKFNSNMHAHRKKEHQKEWEEKRLDRLKNKQKIT